VRAKAAAQTAGNPNLLKGHGTAGPPVPGLQDAKYRISKSGAELMLAAAVCFSSRVVRCFMYLTLVFDAELSSIATYNPSLSWPPSKHPRNHLLVVEEVRV